MDKKDVQSQDDEFPFGWKLSFQEVVFLNKICNVPCISLFHWDGFF